MNPLPSIHAEISTPDWKVTVDSRPATMTFDQATEIVPKLQSLISYCFQTIDFASELNKTGMGQRVREHVAKMKDAE